MAQIINPLPPGLPYHLTSRCNNRDWFQLPMPLVWSIMSDYLYFIHHSYELSIHSFVLMSNHFHLLATPQQENLAAAMNYFLRETSRVIGHESGRINKIWGAPYHKTRIMTQLLYLHTYKYIYRNPVEAGVCVRVEDYPYSTLQGLLGIAPCTIPLADDHVLMSDPEKCLAWLNRSYKNGVRGQIRRALKKREFTLPKVRSGCAPHLLDEEMS
jgi:putative transposase